MLKTRRLRCEPLTIAHADAMHGVLSDDRIYRYLPESHVPSLETLRSRYEFLSKGKSPDGTEHWLNWILVLEECRSLIGFFQATVRSESCSIAYVLNPSFWGHGYATEAGVTIIRHLFQQFDTPSLVAEIGAGNVASKALVKRLGFAWKRYDTAEDDDIYELSRSAWDEHQRQA